MLLKKKKLKCLIGELTMPKQVAEEQFRKAFIKSHPRTYVLKLQVNKDAHNTMPADFFCQTQQADYMIECKQVTCKDKPRPRFDINRFTQEYKISEWEQKFDKNFAFIFLLFWHGTKKKSTAFYIPVYIWSFRKHLMGKRTVNEQDVINEFNEYICAIEHGEWNL